MSGYDRRRRGGASRQPRGSRDDREGRRTPPPEATGAEAEFLRECEDLGTPVSIRTVDGQTIEGRVIGFDDSLIVVASGDGEPVLLRKSDVAYVREFEG